MEQVAGGNADSQTGTGAEEGLSKLTEEGSPDGKADEIMDVDVFVKKWGLDERSATMLEGLSEDSRAKAMADFAPAADTRNMNARFAAWMRIQVRDGKAGSGAKTGGPRARPAKAAEGASQASLDAFVERWELSTKSRQLLDRLPPPAQQAVMLGFSPQPDTEDVDDEFATYAKSTAKAQKATRRDLPVGAGAIGGMPLAHGPPAPPGLAPNSPAAFGSDPVEHFLKQWGLKEQSGRLLRGLAEPLQQAVITGFAPGKHIKDLNGKLYAYVQSKVSEMPAKGPSDHFSLAVSRPPAAVNQPAVPWNIIRHFGERWSLDSRSLDALAQLHPDVCAHVITNFNPPAGTRNVNGRLQAFIRQRMETSRFQQPPPAPMGLQQNWGSPTDTWYDTGAVVPGPGKGGGKAGPRMRAGPAIGSGAPVGGAAAVGGGAAISSGAGKGGAASKGGATGKGGAAIGSVADEESPRRPPLRRGKGSSKGPSPALLPVERDSLDEATAAFLARWDLSAEAQHAVCGLSEELRGRVFGEFEPGEDTRDVSGRLKVFIRTKILPKGSQAPRRRRPDEGAGQAVGARKLPSSMRTDT